MPSDLERPFKHLISVLVLVKPTTTGTELNAVALPLPVILSQHLHAKAKYPSSFPDKGAGNKVEEL